MTNLSLAYQTIRSRKRKTAAIHIDQRGVVVRVPHWVDDDWVDNWVLSKRDWIVKAQEKYRANVEAFCLKIEPYAPFPYLGEMYPIQWAVESRVAVSLQDRQLQISLNKRSVKPIEEQVRAALVSWYKQAAESYLTALIQAQAERMGLTYSLLKIKGFKRRWGSCDSRKVISLNWKLIFCDPALIEYVVIHELAHLIHLNHSKDFWNLVAEYCPEWKVRKEQIQMCSGWILW